MYCTRSREDGPGSSRQRFTLVHAFGDHCSEWRLEPLLLALGIPPVEASLASLIYRSCNLGPLTSLLYDTSKVYASFGLSWVLGGNCILPPESRVLATDIWCDLGSESKSARD